MVGMKGEGKGRLLVGSSGRNVLYLSRQLRNGASAYTPPLTSASRIAFRATCASSLIVLKEESTRLTLQTVWGIPLLVHIVTSAADRQPDSVKGHGMQYRVWMLFLLRLEDLLHLRINVLGPFNLRENKNKQGRKSASESNVAHEPPQPDLRWLCPQ